MMRVPHRKTVIDGITFDSAAEARRYGELKLMQFAGEIGLLELQPTFVLQESFYVYGRKERAIKYTADFRYFENGKTVVEEVKSSWTRKETAYSIRRKLFLRKYGNDVEFREVVR